MKRTDVLLALGLVALVALAGCTGGSPGGNGGQPYQTPLNGTQVAQRHAAVLHRAGSFTYHITLDGSLGNGTGTSQNLTALVDLDSGAYRITTSSGMGDVQIYATGNGTTYTRLSSNGRTIYRKGGFFSYDAGQFVRVGATNLTSNANFTDEGTTTVDGDTLYEYVAHVNDYSGDAALGNLTSGVNATVRLDVRADGLVERGVYRVNSSAGAFTMTARYTDLGSTDPTPSWLAQARANTSSKARTSHPSTART